MKDPKLFDSIGSVLRNMAGIAIVVTLMGGCSWKMWAEPRIDTKIQPLIVGIFEIQTTLNKIVSDSIKVKVRSEVESFEKLLQK